MLIIDNINKTVKEDLQAGIQKGSKMSVAAACFSIYAYQELKKQLEGIEELRFIFTSPTFITEKASKAQREFYIPRISRERSLYGTEFEVKLRNELTQKAIAKECADWIRHKVVFKSNVTQEQMMGFMTVDESTYMPINGFTTVDLGCERGNNAYYPVQKTESFENANYFLKLFEQLWNDKKKLQEVTDVVIENISAAYRENAPEYIYFVALYNISVALKAEENRITVHTDRPDTLSDFIIEADFFIELVEQGELTLNGVTIPLNGASLTDLQERKKNLEYCKDVKKMLDYLGVTEELLLNDLSENDEKNLRNFTGAVLYNRKIGFPNMEQDQLYGAFKIANLVIWIWAKRQLDGMYSIDSFFKLHQIALFTDDDVDLKKPIQASQFVLFDKKGLVHISNMDYEMVYSDISQTPPSPEYCTKVNFLVLDMIGAYDEQTRHDEKLLNLAEKICDWLKSIESMIDPEVLLLNKLQITKRRRTLSMSEIIELAKLTENSYPPATRCGAYLLMDADEEAQKCFDELPLIAQEEFLKYPICHFGKPTMKEDKTNG